MIQASLIPGVVVFRCPMCDREVRWMSQDAPREHQERSYAAARRHGLKIEYSTEKDFAGFVNWCKCEKEWR